MMYMPDAIRATISIMEATAEKIKIRSSYNLAGISVSPREIASEIEKNIPDCTISYQPDERDLIAQSWPENIDDSAAQTDWGWKKEYDLTKMAQDMLCQLARKKNNPV